MEYKLDELLHNLHKYLFADAEQIITELRHYCLDRSHQEAELAFISSKIFNSQESLLQFLRQNSQLNERILSTVKKRIYELIIEYIKNRKQEVSGYLDQIKQTCMVSFLGDQNSLVKEVSLFVLIKIIETYKEIEPIIKPAELILTLLDEIKLRRPAATVKGAIWQLIGLLHSQYPQQVNAHIEESQDVQYQMLEEQVRTKKPEIKAIIGMLKGFQHSFEVECTLTQQQKQGLFLLLTTLSQPIEDVNNRGVMKSAMKLMATHANLFSELIMAQAMRLIERALQLCTFENLEVRDAANDLLGSLIKQISESLQADKDEHISMFKNILHQFDEILHSNDFKNVQLLSAIRAVGIFSKAIQTILGNDKLWEYLKSLTELSEQKLIKEFMEQDKPESDLHNFKYILKKQKQLIAYIESYSFMIRNINREPSEALLMHFMKVGSIGVNNHRKLYNKYRFRFYESLAQLTMSLTGFKNAFAIWIKKFVRQSLTETLKIPDSVVFGGESPAESLQDAVMFWREYLCKDEIWSEQCCRQVYDEIMTTCIHDIEELDLNYKITRTAIVSSSQDGAGEDNSRANRSSVEYTANNSNDQQYLVRLSNFLEKFLPDCKDQWFAKWIPRFCQIIVKKATQTPRIPKLYVLIKTAIQISTKHQYFEGRGMDVTGDDEAERSTTFNMLLSFLKELIGKSEEFQDELLESTVGLLLNVPIVIIYQADSSVDNLHLWKGVMIKALGLSQLNNRLAMTCITTLEKWFNALPVSLVAELYADVLPKLSNFLYIESSSDNKGQETYFFQDLIKETKEERVDRRDIANKVLDLLGKIGGHAHSIINNELTKQHDKENFIRWDAEKRLKLSLPLHNTKIDIYLDSALPRIIDLAQNSSEKKTRIAACELLHGLVLYMIGKSATRPKGSVKTEKDREDMAAFAKLYAKLFPVIIRLATEIEQISRQLFEPLVFQIVRWFSSSKIYEHPEVESLLDALIEGSQSRNNSALREMCSNAVAEFAKWSLKQMSDTEIRENPSNIKSLLRRIESNSNHPDPFKRLSSVLCLSKILMVVREFDALIDRFCLEIARCVLSSLKQCHNSFEFSQDVIENCSELLQQIQKLIISKADILFKENQQRAVHVSLYEFLDFTFSKFTAIETVFRREAIKLWEGLVLALPKRLQIKSLILTKYVPETGQKPIFWSIQAIQFTESKAFKASQQHAVENKKAEYLERQKQMDSLSAQLEFLCWLIKVGKFQYAELQSKLRLDMNIIRQNVTTFISQVVQPNFEKVVKKSSLSRLLTCKEDREQLTKSKLRLFTEFFVLLEQLTEGEIADFVPTSDANFIMNLAVQIMLVPASHKLNLLVQDYQLEKRLRVPCEAYIRRTLSQRQSDQDACMEEGLSDIVYKLAVVDLPQINLNRIAQDNAKQYHPRLLANLLLGYLKLGQICAQIKENNMEIASTLAPVVETWIQCDTPAEVESGRLLVSFMAQLSIPNTILSEWLTSKSEVYHKTNGILLKYIADYWLSPTLQVGTYLVEKAKENLDLLSVFVPILEHLSQKTPGYQKVIISKIPHNWNNAAHSVEYAEKQVQIYSIILQKCQWTFEQAKMNEESLTFINFVIQQAKNFLQSDKFSIYFQKQVLHLIGLLYSLNLSESIHQKVRPVLEAFLMKQSPVVSRDLGNNKNQITNYEKLLEGFFDLLDLSGSPSILQILRRVISEHKPRFLAERIKASLNNFVLNVANSKPSFSQFFQVVEPLLNAFFDEAHTQIADNYRWAVASKLINRILETCPSNYLENLFIKIFEPRLQESLKRPLTHLKNLPLYLLVREQTHVMLMLEIFVRRLEADSIKNKITKTLYGPDAAQTELLKYLIQVSDDAKKERIPNFEQRCADLVEHIQLPELNSLKQVARRYACAGYTLCSSTILKTQTKISVFTNYLFGAFDVIVDCEDDQLYQFSVQTNFNTISLQSIEAKAFKKEDIAQVKKLNLLDEYVTSSFMATNSNFNSALVFETQLDQVNEQQSLLRPPTDASQEQSATTLEIDQVNKHECMKNIKRTLDKMSALFRKQWAEEGTDSLPQFMQVLLGELKTGHLNIKIFVLKLLVNNQDMFKPYAQFWVKSICEFITGKQTGGKGIHYFIRDLCTLLVLWSDTYKPTDRAMCSKVINTLIRLAADKSKIIFNINIEILAMLMHKWRTLISIDKDMLVKMLQVPDQTDGSHLWKMTAIQMLALACTFDIPISPVSQHDNPEGGQFKMEQQDQLMAVLLRLQELKKKQLIFASSEALGKVLACQPGLTAFCLPYLMQNDAKERHDIIVNVIERITREFPQLLQQRRIFLKLISYINVMTGAMRGTIFKTLARYFPICSQQEQQDIYKSLIAISEDILADISEENQKQFLVLLSLIVKCDHQAGSELLQKVAHRLKPLFVTNKSDTVRELFYDLMVYLYDKFDEFKGYAKSSLIRGLADPQESIRKRIVEYWSDASRLKQDPVVRAEQLLSLIYDQDEEQTWLNNAVYLLLQASRQSADFDRKIFDEPLSNCQFDPLHINQFKMNLNRSQPVTPSLAQISLVTASQYFQQQQQRTLPAIKEVDDQEMSEDNSQNKSQDKLKVAGMPSQESQPLEQAFAPGFIRATQNQGKPLFNPSQVISSSLVISGLQYSQSAHGLTGLYNQQSQQELQQDFNYSQAFYEPQGQKQLKIFKIKEEDQTEQSFEEPKFQVPGQQLHRQKSNSTRTQFFESNYINYNPVQESSDGSMIRIVKDGSMPSQLARQDQIKLQQKKQLMKAHSRLQKEQISMLRQYRTGEIPDIQIDYKDILLPLMALTQMDSTISTEILVELFVELYKSTKDPAQRKRLGDGVSCILSQSLKFDYGMINSMHRIAIELLKIDGFTIDASVIERTGRLSMSFQTSLLLLEETIIHGRKFKSEQPLQRANNHGKVTVESKNYWFSLIQLFEMVGNEDALKGIWCSIGESKSVMLKAQVNLSQSTQSAANLIRQAQSHKSKGEIKKGLQVLESVLSTVEFDNQFEEQVKEDLMNKEYESLSELLKWEQIATIATQRHQNLQLYQIPHHQAISMIRAQLRCETQWQKLNHQMQMWQDDALSKQQLDRRFNYEQAMMFVTARDFDRARFYINREANDLLNQWKDLTKLSEYAQHILVQKIQKIYEMKEFLTTTKQLSLKNYDELTPEALQQLAHWVQRRPSFSFDKLSVWDDILTSRLLFVDLYRFNFGQGSFTSQLDGKQPTKFQEIQNLSAKLYAQVAKGAFKMGLYDSCDKYLMTCLEQRSKTKQRDNLRIVVPIIKLKTEQFKQETLNLSYRDKYDKLEKVLRVLDDKIEKDESKEFYTQIKALTCKQNLHKKFMNIVYKDMVSTKESKLVKPLAVKYIQHVQSAFQIHDKSVIVLKDHHPQSSSSKQQQMQAKSLYCFSKMCYKILKQLESEQLSGLLGICLQQIGHTSESLALMVIKNSFGAINLGYLQARDSIPRMLDIIAATKSQAVDHEFIESSKVTPAWVFLRWISQLAAVLNRSKSDVIAEKVKQISRKYPHALFYPFKVIESNLKINLLESEQQPTQLFQRIQQLFENRFQNLLQWTDALDSLVHPEHRLQSWIDLIQDVAKQGSDQIKAKRIQQLVQLMIADVANPQVQRGLGSYNLKFAQKWHPYLSQLARSRKSLGDLINEVKNVKEKIQEYSLGQGQEKLSAFSEYLSELDNNDFYNSEVYIEIPGQYDNQNSEPVPGKNVKIACLRKSCLILSSIRRPKRITVHGSNEKDYNLLIKGGEDLRLDQRIQQLFHIMNGIFKEDPACQSRGLNLKTFNVVPITNRLGSLEWVDNTEPLKTMINREHVRLDRHGKGLNNSMAITKVKEFLEKLPDNKGVDDIRQQHLALMMLDSETCIQSFNRNKSFMQWSLLRQGLENLCLTSSAFISIKDQFIKSIAVFSIASYLLGIGDRHLENFLVSTTDGEVLGIDYGCAFGSGVQLAVPELIPFRLTQQIEGVIAPHPMEGVYKQTMVHVLNALRKRKSLILDTCDIFVKEPLLDWISSARQKMIEHYGRERIQRDEELLKLSFYPKQKIQTLKEKLNGANPVKVVHEELKDSNHYKMPYYNALLEALQGPEGGLREKLLQQNKDKGTSRYLDVETQVDCLIELARCPDILGRAWIGWGAYI